MEIYSVIVFLVYYFPRWNWRLYSYLREDGNNIKGNLFWPSYDSELNFSWSDSNTYRDSVLVPVLGVHREAALRNVDTRGLLV